jgi:hypothetical protein
VIPGTESVSRTRRGAFLGDRYLLYVDRGLHVTDLTTGEDHLALERPSNGNFQSVACARTGGICYVVRTTDNADIWQRTIPEAASR